MRLQFDSQGYVCCILYGCSTGSCVEYTGAVPNQPEEYADIDDWADRAKVQAYKLDTNGNLTYDAAKAATLPGESDVVLVPYTDAQLEALGITAAIRKLIDVIYPVGSIYLSVNEANPATLFGGTWERVKDTFLLASGDSYAAGSTGGAESHKHVSPTGYNPDNKYLGVSYAAGTNSITVNGSYAAIAQKVTTGSGRFSLTLPNTGSSSNMPPYLAVFVWKRTA